MYFDAAEKTDDVELYELMEDLRNCRREEHLKKIIDLPEVSKAVNDDDVVEQLRDEKEKGNQLTIAAIPATAGDIIVKQITSIH